MPDTSILDPARTSPYYRRLIDAARSRQRWLLLCGGTTYAVAWLWIGFRIGAPPDFALVSLALLPITLALYGLTFVKTARWLLECNPVVMAVTLAGHIVVGAAAIPQGSTPRVALQFCLLMFLVILTAPTLRSNALAVAISLLIVAGSALVVLPGEALGLILPAAGAATLAAVMLERERRAVFDLRLELERRATSDNLSGVSNRAHIMLLAQNEFARARRYREPYACLIIEVDDFETLAAAGAANPTGTNAADVILQMFSGYCVVVMRHCDSFGRLGPARFLALLPETRGLGAFTLASRMCRELAAFDVMVEGRSVKFTVSIGTTELDASDRWAGDMLRRAEQALEDAIERGRGCAVLGAPPALPPDLANQPPAAANGPKMPKA